MSDIQNIADGEQEQEQSLSELLQIRRDKLEDMQNSGNDPFVVTSYDVSGHAADIVKKFEENEEEVTYRIAGRVMNKRDMGKASFVDLHDVSGRIQIYIRVNDVGDEAYAGVKKLDLGDIVGIEGFVFRTKRGEISIHAKAITLLSKSLRPLPEKWHGLKDTDLRYRQRYVDLIVNPEVKDTFIKRSIMVREIRKFLDGRDFLEVETPVLHTIPGGAAARPFITHHNALDMDLYMRIALELHLKRLIVGGLERVYEIGRVFRNEGIDVRHNPEFTLLELYQAYTDYEGMMNLTEDLFRHVAHAICGTGKINFGGVELDLDKPFERITMKQAVKRYAEVDFDELETLDDVRKCAKDHHIKYEEHHLKGDIMNLFFEEYCEDKLIQPTFLTGHPVEISPLAKRDPKNPGYTERFELFIIGREYANAFSELNDPIDQRGRFERQSQLRAAGDEEATPPDEDFLNALEYGMPPTGGLGIGIDRLAMMLTDSASIRDVLLFPTMKPESK